MRSRACKQAAYPEKDIVLLCPTLAAFPGNQ